RAVLPRPPRQDLGEDGQAGAPGPELRRAQGGPLAGLGVLAMRSALLLSTTLAAALAAGCFNPEEPDCSYRCGPQSLCPDNYECASDGYCHRKGGSGSCPFKMPDLVPGDMTAPPDLVGVP